MVARAAHCASPQWSSLLVTIPISLIQLPGNILEGLAGEHLNKVPRDIAPIAILTPSVTAVMIFSDCDHWVVRNPSRGRADKCQLRSAARLGADGPDDDGAPVVVSSAC